MRPLGSYEKFSLKKFTRLEVLHNKIHTIALEEGKRIESWEEERRSKIKEAEGLGGSLRKSPEVFHIHVDGTGVNKGRDEFQ